MYKKEVIKELIKTIESEIDKSNQLYYNLKEGGYICADVGYVEEWFKEYKKVLENRYGL